MLDEPKEKTKHKNNNPTVWQMRVALAPIVLMFLVVGLLMVAGFRIQQEDRSIDITRTAIAEINTVAVGKVNLTHTKIAIGKEAEANTEITVTPTSQPCFWNWSYGNEDEEGAAELDAALQAAGYEASVRVPEFGEDYICGIDENRTATFHVMDVSPVITLTVDHAIINDETALGELLVDLLPIVDSVEYSARVREIEVQFIADETVVNWRTQYHEIVTALEAGVSADEIFQLSMIAP